MIISYKSLQKIGEHENPAKAGKVSAVLSHHGIGTVCGTQHIHQRLEENLAQRKNDDGCNDDQMQCGCKVAACTFGCIVSIVHGKKDAAANAEKCTQRKIE